MKLSRSNKGTPDEAASSNNAAKISPCTDAVRLESDSGMSVRWGQGRLPGTVIGTRVFVLYSRAPYSIAHALATMILAELTFARHIYQKTIIRHAPQHTRPPTEYDHTDAVSMCRFEAAVEMPHFSRCR